MLDLPTWFHELATLATLAVAAAWLTVHWLRVGKPRGSRACARCEHNALGPAPAATTTTSRGVRSKQLRVLD